MESDRLQEKIRRLLALSKSSNPHEAALAAAKAQELLRQHSEYLNNCREDSPMEFFLFKEKVPQFTFPMGSEWGTQLGIMLQKFQPGIKIMAVPMNLIEKTRQDMAYLLVGPEAMVITISELIEFIWDVMQRTAIDSYQNYLNLQTFTRGISKESFLEGYYQGFVEGLRRQIDKIKSSYTASDSRMLSIVNRNLVRYCEQFDVTEVKSARPSSACMLSPAFSDGVRQGEKCSLNPQIETCEYSSEQMQRQQQIKKFWGI